MRDRVLSALERAFLDDPSDPIDETPEGPVLRVYVAGSRGPIIVHAAYAMQDGIAVIGSLGFNDSDGQSLARPHPPRL